MHVPSQPLMRSLLSQSQTPTLPRRNRRFFRVRVSSESLHRTESPSLLRTSYGLLKPTLSAIDASHPKRERRNVNAQDWCNGNIFLASAKLPKTAKIAAESRYITETLAFPQPFPHAGARNIVFGRQKESGGNQRNVLTGKHTCLILSGRGELNVWFCRLRRRRISRKSGPGWHWRSHGETRWRDDQDRQVDRAP